MLSKIYSFLWLCMSCNLVLRPLPIRSELAKVSRATFNLVFIANAMEEGETAYTMIKNGIPMNGIKETSIFF
ncbi:hypothetical protein L1887_26362 [Cichorium endivia]|nr:hypothetical protein L1887_26362 [Cichorium endivia]